MRLSKSASDDRWHVRPDGVGKVTGELKYLTDMRLPGMLHGKVLRSPHPHAWILSIRTEKASRLPGVHAVITHEDVPGMNRFGIAFPDQPALCEDRVRYVGDAVAAVAAETEELAEYALGLIEVDYEPLPVIDSPEAGLDPAAPKLHPAGNVLHRTNYKRGDAEEAFSRCAYVVEGTYETPRQMHTYLETEGGLFVPEPHGRLTIYSATQHGFKDRMQLSRILGMPEACIRVVSSPIGGSFGGKDELNVQPYGALLALKSGKPVKMHNTRKESVRAGIKRHPMKIRMKTGIDGEGRIIAHQVRITADTGAYATLGAPVLNFATEHASGPYRIGHVDIEGISVYTNNGVSGEFRGFGGNQVVFAMEGQMDRLAEAAGIDPWQLRHINLRGMGDPGPFAQRIVQTDGARQVWASVAECALWSNRHDRSGRPEEPWLRIGTGAAITMHGAGLGFGIPDPAGGTLRLTADGKIQAAFGYEEFGQGLLASLELMLKDLFCCAAGDLEIVIGDTDRVPHSGSSTASRATSMMWMALQRMKGPFKSRLLGKASELTGLPAERLETGPGGVYEKGGEGPLVTYKEVAAACGEPLSTHTEFHYPTTPDAIMGAHYLYTYAAVCVKVMVNLLTGRVKVLDQYHAVAAGPVINPQGYLGQIEGGSVMALGFTLTEDALMDGGQYVTKNLDTYLIPTLSDIHERFELHAIEELPEGDSFGPRGVGEVGSVALAPAIVSAIHDATGVRIAKLPVSPEKLQRHFARILAGEGEEAS
ncbi:xanthine dehydrogenase subunit D [Paenibacillus hamazuiensis]|uniref:xanthine dehydrogenase subunit D n=1 Tax=Paenibacillus hamazuiensis TaxID=2936508 RepID=UPI0020108782|nr:xanthine dehydrogenase subunit D [Paenibacillus hamazuiensis]